MTNDYNNISQGMTFDFDEIIPRRNTGSYKWDSTNDKEVLPMWVADMDFRTAPPIIEALRKRVEHGIFGYTKVPDAYYDAIINWFAKRHNWNIQRDWIIYTSGVVPAISATIKAMTQPGDRIIVQTPVYNCFFSSIRNNDCEVQPAPLVWDGQTYHIDFESLERIASDPLAKILLLCNPHNPAGRVWTREELTRIGDICLRHNILVVSDEIHCELTFKGHDYTPFASISEEFLLHSVTCNSPSKAFNIAGLQIANIISAVPKVRSLIDKAININEVCDVNPFGVTALIAAYNEGEAWLEQLKQYLWENYLYLKEFFARNLPQFPIADLEGTYLVWVDCSAMSSNAAIIVQRLLTEGKVWVNEGSMYGEAGKPFIRINIACPRAFLKEGLKRIYNVLHA